MTKPAPTSSESVPLSAMIVGTGLIPGYLLRTLEEYGCQTLLYPTDIQLAEKAPRHKADYFFQFGNWSTLPDHIRTYLTPQGKGLFIETALVEAETVTPPAAVRIFRAGDVDQWQPAELVDAMLTHFFSRETTAVANERREPSSPVLPSPPPPLPPPIEQPRPRETPSPIIPPYQPLPSFPPVVSVKKIAPPPADIPLEVVHHRRLPRLILLTVVGLLAAVGLVTVMITWHVRALTQSLQEMKTHLVAADWIAVRRDLSRSKEELTQLERISSTTALLHLPYTAEAQRVISVSDTLLTTTDDTLTFLSTFRLQDTGSFTGQKISPQDLARAQAKIDHAAVVMNNAKIQLEATDLPLFPKESVIAFLSNTQQQLTTLQQVFPFISELLGKETKKTYLVLLQNPMELRPTGGFIGSFALLTLDHGAVEEFRILDVYDADGQLKGHVDPPLPIRTYLNQPNWFLRDSNFDPDFAASATWGLWFLNKELNIPADGVIGVNLFFIQDVLRAIGPLTLPDFGNETVYANTFFQKAHDYTEGGFFPGSTQKKDYLRAVSTALMSKLTGSPNLPWLDLLTTTKTALDEKNLLAFSKDATSQTVFEQHGWAGRISAVQCAGPETANGCYADYLAFSDANLGVNKANYYVQKEAAVQKSINAQGRVATIVTLHYSNKNAADPHYADTYKDYLRLFIPAGSSLAGITVNDTPLSPTQVDVQSYGTDKTSIGFLLTVAPQTEATIKIGYTLSQPVTASTHMYQLLFQKQGGDKTASLQLSVAGLAPYQVTPKNFTASKRDDQSLSLSTDTAVDRVFALTVGR